MVLTPFETGYSQEMTSEEYVLNGEVKILRATHEPCIVCGEPGGNCAGELEPPKYLLGSNTFPSLGHDDTYVVPEDVLREVPISDKTTTTVLVAAKDSVMPLKRAQELGIC